MKKGLESRDTTGSNRSVGVGCRSICKKTPTDGLLWVRSLAGSRKERRKQKNNLIRILAGPRTAGAAPPGGGNYFERARFILPTHRVFVRGAPDPDLDLLEAANLILIPCCTFTIVNVCLSVSFGTKTIKARACASLPKIILQLKTRFYFDACASKIRRRKWYKYTTKNK